MVKLCLIFCLIVFLPIAVEAQSDSLSKHPMDLSQMSKNINNKRKLLSIEEEKMFLKLLKKDNSKLNTSDKHEIINACVLISKKVASARLRKELVKTIAETCTNDFSRTCNDGFFALTNFRTSDFDKSSKQSIKERITIDTGNWNSILLAGFLNLEELAPKYENRLKAKSAFYHPWYLHRYLARLGKQEEIDYCIGRVDLSGKPNYRLLDQLLYIRQPELINVYNFYLQSDTVDPGSYDVMPMPYAEIGARLLARLLEDFPLKERISSSLSPPDQIALARQWMLANKGKYKIRRDEF